ncbi:MAG: TonB-dependent receptor [Prolixibacteraceae bacterium]
MANSRLLFFFILCLMLFTPAFGQDRIVVLSGKIVGPDQQPLPNVNIKVKNSQQGTYSDLNGVFRLQIKTGNNLVLLFSILNYETVERTFSVTRNTTIVQEMKPLSTKIPEIEVKEQKKSTTQTINLDPRLTNRLSSAGGGAVEQLVKTLPGVSSRNELSPQYSVRGGNYDENLLYVNGIEIFRPFSVKTGEQEGLSFVNPDLVSGIRFSSGGFESSYGDKMSSVLDIDYKTPTLTRGTAEVGALGASAHIEGSALQNKFTYLTGIRYRDNRYLLGTLDQKGHYDPAFFDFQALLRFDFSPKFSMNFMANVANNNYLFTPETRETKYGTMAQSYLLKIYFEGNEKDQYANRFAALSGNFHPNKNIDLQLTASSFYSDEKQRYDIMAQYYLNEVINGVNPVDHPDSTMLLGIGSSLVHASDFLQANIFNIEHRGKFISEKHRLQWGIKYQRERIHDQVNEWEMRDSAGYSLPYNNQQVHLYSTLKADNHLNSQRFSAFIEDNFATQFRNSSLKINYGGRIQYWDFNNQTIFSPRISITYLPDRDKSLQFRAAWGIYQQMPFFKELKNRAASIVTDVRAQKSVHYLLGADYPFLWDNRPFKFSTELYYKSLTHLIPYKVVNLNLQYFPEQQSKGYATGLEMRLYGEPVKGAVSWISMTVMKSEEDVAGDHFQSVSTGKPPVTIFPGYLPRPSDQRFMLSLFFQDYLPQNPTTKMNLTLLFGTGIPFGPPHSERWMDTFRMPPYRRVDLGISKMLTGKGEQKSRAFLVRSLKEAWLSLEIFNLFDLNNTISYYWVSDFQNQMHAVPNYLTGRRINLKASVSF